MGSTSGQSLSPKDGKEGRTLELEAEDLGHQLWNLRQITWTFWTCFLYIKMGETIISSACIPVLVLESDKKLYGTGFVNPEDHKCGSDGGGGSSGKRSSFYCQPHGYQFISIHLFYFGSPALCLMVS